MWEHDVLQLLEDIGRTFWTVKHGDWKTRNPSMELILWDARFFIATKVANGCEFPLEAILLLYFYTYTCTFWKLLNQNLKPSGSAKEAVQARTWNPIINMLQRTLNLLPSPRGPEFQTAYVVCSSVQYDVVESEGVVITVPIFLSATSDFQLARLLIKDNLHLLYVIKHRRGKSISAYSCCEAESEVLFPPGAKFRVRQVLQATGNPEQDKEYTDYRVWLMQQAGQPGRLPATIVELHDITDTY
jgi:hypothetical protein